MVLPYRESRKLAWLGQMRGTSGALAWAIACGRGAITSDARAFAEEIGSGNGAAFAQGDVPALARRIELLLEQPRLLRDWAERVVARSVAGEGAFQIDGQMVDAPVIARATAMRMARMERRMRTAACWVRIPN
mgnify:CR=1 FL=1